jgi:putative FmdB family regulatory protein
MPIYDYVCSACGHGFERIRRVHERTAALACPQCGGTTAPSLTAPARVGGGGASRALPITATGGGGSCCGGGCGCA